MKRKLVLIIFILSVSLMFTEVKADADNDCCTSNRLQLDTWGSSYIYPDFDVDMWYMDTENRWISLTNGNSNKIFDVNVWDKCNYCPGSGRVDNFITTCFFWEPYSKCSFPATAGVTYLAVSDSNGDLFNPYKIKFQYECGENQCYSSYWDKCYWNGDLCCDGDIVDKQWYCQDENTWKGCTDDSHNVCEESDNGVYVCQKGYYEGKWRWRDCSSCYDDCRYPDLVIPDAWFDPPPAKMNPNLDTKIYFKLKNFNDVTSAHPIVIGYYLDGEFKQELFTNYLDAFEEETLYTIDRFSCGDHNIELIADYNNDMTESDEGNNGMGIFFSVDCKDLTVTDIQVLPDPPYAEQSTRVDFSIKNLGDQKITEGFYNKIYVDNVEKKSIYETDDFSSQMSKIYANPLNVVLGCGYHTIKVKTDSENYVFESNEGNNEMSKTYYWSCPSGKTCKNGECCECSSGVCCDGCHYYQEGTSCGTGKECDGNGNCLNSCTNECSSGQTRCNGNIKQTCGNYDADSCLEWGNDFDCGSDYCGSWQANYCKSNNVYHNRTCHDKGCSLSSCFDNVNTEEQLVQTCSYGCSIGVCSALQGDTNGDCKVDIFDLAKIGLCYGKAPTGTCTNADLNQDGKINIFDLATVGLNYGKSC